MDSVKLLLAGLLILGSLAGCIDDGADEVAAPTFGGLVPVAERHQLPYEIGGEWSYTLAPGAFDILPAVPIDIPVELPVTEATSSSATGLTVNLGLFMPDVPEGTKVPVIVDAGPYYAGTSNPGLQTEGDTVATEPANRLGRFLIENFVPHGYAVAQLSVTGTGDSGGCMDLMGLTEQLGIDAGVTWLGEQEWSNGNVALIGRSYDGSTPWEAATTGNPHLKTIVPISGLTGVHELMWRNGSAELRAPGLLYGIYAAMTFDGDANDAGNLCADNLLGGPQGVAAYVTGDQVAPAANDYWVERYFFDRVLENYNGSVYYIHGLQDWNVDPHMAFPYYNRLLDAGYEVKGLFGQWGHMYPDREAEHSNLGDGYGAQAFPNSVRYDWAQDLLEWFNYYLKETGPQPSLHVEVQDHMGAWRFEQAYPPRDATRVELGLDQAARLHDGPDVVFGECPALEFCLGDGPLGYEFGPLDAANDTRIAGNAWFHVTVTPGGPGGQLFARLIDAETGLRLGHAVMDLRFAAGGNQMQPVVPGLPLVAMMEFQAMDVILPAGHGLLLEVFPTGEDYLPSVVTDPVVIDVSGASVLSLPTVQRGDEAFFTPPGQR